MISTLIGKGGENVRQLQDELGGLHLNIESFDEMPDSLANASNPHWRDNSDRRGKGSRDWEQNPRGQNPRKGKGKKNRR
jgi:hypothetical protein